MKDKETKETIEGIIGNVIFHNHENGYSVFCLETDSDEEIVCVGNIIEMYEGENIKITGIWISHPVYGEQFKIDLYEKNIPKTENGIERYLASGVIKGIGSKLAKKIVAKFGVKTFEIIEEQPQRLSEIKGITEEKAQTISQTFYEQKELRDVIIYLQEYNITPTYAAKIYKKYKSHTMYILKSNPYKLADDIFGIGFKLADKIAQNIGVSLNSSNRIKSGIKYILTKEANNGHVYLPYNVLIDEVSEILDIPQVLIENSLLELKVDKEIYEEDSNDEPKTKRIYLSLFYNIEISTAKKLLELSEFYNNTDDLLIEKKIDCVEQFQAIKLAPNQRQAVKEALKTGVLVITGGPGTGKTTTINTIISLLESEGNIVLLAAPTGRAAKRMTEATSREAQTIHRLLGINFLQEDSKKQSFEKNEDNPIEADVIIVDEVSMVDILLMNNLLKAVVPGTRLIFVGDADQLPSVGSGNVLKDIIRSNCIRVVKLDKVFRQAEESAIIRNAHKINNGEYPIINEKDKDFFFMKRTSADSVVETVIELVTKRLPKYINSNNKTDIQVLTPMRKTALGVISLNQSLQDALNPHTKTKREKEFRNLIYREGDKVMQIKNNYNTVWYMTDDHGTKIDEGIGMFNGDEGTIININVADSIITVLFDDGKIVEYDNTQLDELDLAYAVTIHKSQGSEYPVVVIPLLSGPPMLMSRNLLYTAVTRAKKLVVIVGLKETINKMIDNNKEINRYTSLDERLKSFYNIN